MTTQVIRLHCHPEDLTGEAVQTAQMLYCNEWFFA